MNLLEIGALVAVCWSVFSLGRLWERDHPQEDRP